MDLVPLSWSGVLSVCVLAMSWSLNAQAARCSHPLEQRQKQMLTDYVRKKYKIADSIALSLKRDDVIGDTCFRELTFEGKTAFRTWELTLYSSPDARFISSDLFDTSIDPIAEQRLKDEAVMKGLVESATAVRGPEHATVTIVEFSDFECPFCRNFSKVLKDALADEPNDIRVVFHHMPLSMHPWAKMAAETAGCAQLQSPETFWSLHDSIFENQTTISIENAKEKLAALAKNTKGLDATAFQKCMDSAMSVGLVLKDIDLAENNQISGTPTVFINGHRLPGLDSAEKLRELIDRARKEAVEPAENARAQR